MRIYLPALLAVAASTLVSCVHTDALYQYRDKPAEVLQADVPA
jgi:hypothetical protein